MIKKYIETYKEMIAYLFFGVLTTLVNFVIYFSCTQFLHWNYLVANALSWAGAVAFAYVTNRIWVFQSKNRGLRAIFKEITAFVGCRLFSGAMDMAIMFIGVEVLGISDDITKLLTQVVVVVLNYIFSKIIFRS